MQKKLAIVDARWSPRVNYLLIECDCGNQWWHPANRKRVACRECFATDDLMRMKSEDEIKLRKQ